MPQRQREAFMRAGFSASMSTAAIVAAAVSSVMSLSITPLSAQGPVASESQLTATLNTPWGEPDLQGIWTD
jgi:hypothetical protein